MSTRDAGMRVPDHIKWVMGGIMNDIKCMGKKKQQQRLMSERKVRRKKFWKYSTQDIGKFINVLNIRICKQSILEVCTGYRTVAITVF